MTTIIYCFDRSTSDTSLEVLKMPTIIDVQYVNNLPRASRPGLLDGNDPSVLRVAGHYSALVTVAFP